jgi:hypothetical protein
MICRDWARLEQIFGPPDDLPTDAIDLDPSARQRIMINTDAGSQVVKFVDEIHSQYHEMLHQTPGFVSWSTYFKNNIADRSKFPLLTGLDNEVILQKYNTLTMGSSQTQPHFPY